MSIVPDPSTAPEPSTSPEPTENVSFDFRGINYEGIRNEFINIFSSFRTLVIAQLTALAFVGKEIFTATEFERSLGLNFVFTLVVLLPTIIGHNWLAQAIYQVSYIFVAYELPALGKIVSMPGEPTIETRNPLWVLSNRVKGKVPRPHLAPQSNVYMGGADARSFHVLQIIFSLLILVFATRMSGSSWENLNKQDNDTVYKTVLWVLNEIVMIAAVIVCGYFWYISRTITLDATNHWMAYFNNRDEHDKAYLRNLNRDFIRKVGLEKYVWTDQPISNTP